jgi:tetratricopeptide (TPR) repeat protein
MDALSNKSEDPHLKPIKKEISEALSDKVEILCIFGKYNEALERCKKAIKLDEKHKEAWNNKGEALMFLESYDEAIRLQANMPYRRSFIS